MMKKFFSFFCYIAIAIAAVSLVSCGDDDDILDPEPTPEPEPELITVYTAVIGDNALDIFDITLSFYHNSQKEDVVLAKNMITPFDPEKFIDVEGINSYYRATVNGEEGIDSVIAKVTVKPDLEAIVASKEPTGKCTWYCEGVIKYAKKAANGDYSSYCIPTLFYGNFWNELMTDADGIPVYERAREYVQNALTY